MDTTRHWQRITRLERVLWSRGYRFVAGVDEAGRGPLAGPVVTAAVVLSDDEIPGLNDSKLLSTARREELYQYIQERAISVSVRVVPVGVIERLNILHATLTGMQQAVAHLKVQPEFVLVDGNWSIPELKIAQRPVVRGDKRCACIAAASIIAKVTRDRLMVELDRKFPGYGFAQNKGYPTKQHIAALWEKGPTPVHRRTFNTVRQLLEKQEA